jgi:hypothetical protein
VPLFDSSQIIDEGATAVGVRLLSKLGGISYEVLTAAKSLRDSCEIHWCCATIEHTEITARCSY